MVDPTGHGPEEIIFGGGMIAVLSAIASVIPPVAIIVGAGVAIGYGLGTLANSYDGGYALPRPGPHPKSGSKATTGPKSTAGIAAAAKAIAAGLSSVLAKEIAEAERTKDNQPRYVYRALNPIDVKTIAVGKGIQARGIGPVTKWQHIEDPDTYGKISPWISVTRDPVIAFEKYYHPDRGVAKIDLSKIEAIDPIPELKDHPVARKKAIEDSEMLVYGMIPQSAIVEVLMK